MKLQILQEELSKALNVCSRFSSSRVQLPVLGNILIEATKNKCRLNSTNLEVSVSLSIGAKVTEEGSLTVPSKIITDLVSNLKPGQTELISNKENLEIKNSEFEARLSGMNSSDFPAIPHDVGAGSIKLSGDVFLRALNRLLFAVSTDETRPVLTGILLIFKDKEINLVATDGFRLSQEKIKVEGIQDEKRIIIPKNVLSELIRIAEGKDIEFSFKKSENLVIFGIENIILSSRIIEGDFPDFERIIPKESKLKVKLDKDEFLRNIKLASVFAKDSANVVKVGI